MNPVFSVLPPMHLSGRNQCHPCLCTSTLKLRTSDVMNVLLPKVHHEPIIVEL